MWWDWICIKWPEAIGLVRRIVGSRRGSIRTQRRLSGGMRHTADFFCPKKMDPIWEQNLIMLLPCFLAQLSFQDNLVLLAYWTLYVFNLYQNDSSTTHVLTTKNRGFQGGTSGKEPTCQCKRQNLLSQEDPLEEGMEILSSIPAWRIPWTEETGMLQSMGSQRIRHDWSDLAHTHNHE